MGQKAKGGRGVRAADPYERFSATLPPALKAYLDAQAETAGLTRSEMLAKILEDHQALSTRPRAKAPAKAEGESTTSPLGGPSTALTAPRKKLPSKKGDLLPKRVEVQSASIIRSVRGKLRWDKERYVEVENLLRQGKIISRSSHGLSYVTESGEEMSWRTLEALVKLNVLKELD